MQEMLTVRVLIAVCVCGAAAANADDAQPMLPAAATRTVRFDRDVRPILEQRCWDCHGPHAQESGLRLDRREAVLQGGDSGEPAMVAGRSGDSRLVRLVSGADPDRVMPPDGKRLTSGEIGILRAWIDQGAEWPADDAADSDGAELNTDFWSFQPLRAAVPPAVRRTDFQSVRPSESSDAAAGSTADLVHGLDGRSGASSYAATPLDAFILQKLEQAELAPSPRADAVALIRRLHLDVLGLPPAPDEIDEFIADAAPDAWPRLVDRALASPHYGERWAQHWLDLARFAETDGFEMNQERPDAWRYRDYVIAALNADTPYDRFIIEQLAGDAVGADAATGFLVAGAYDKVKSPDVTLTLMQRQDELADMINTTGTAFLGLTIACARCHNHKFDPVLQRDYYAMQAVFAGVEHGNRPIGRREDGERQRELAQLAAELAQTEAALEGLGVRPPVNPRQNEERFAPVAARFLRFTIRATNNGIEPCLDELEVFASGVDTAGDAEPRNVALATAGVRTTASGTYPGSAIHKLEHLNDGRYGNERSWISNEHGRGWVTLEFPESAEIDRITWGRDRNGKYADRLPTDYDIEVSLDGSEWRRVAGSAGRLPFGTEGDALTSVPGDRTDSERERLESLFNEYRALTSRRDALSQQSDEILAYAGMFRQPEPVHRLYRGDPMSPREVVPPDALTALGTIGLTNDAPERQRRLELARWIASPENPLTARVIVNRLWQHHFGRGLVDTPSDFGRNGARPTHPDLLDWLAAELVGQEAGGRNQESGDGKQVAGASQTQRTTDNGPRPTSNPQPSTLHAQSSWSLKRLHRLILLSSTYQQSSAPHPHGLERDAQTRLLWRFPPRRLAAEVIHDSTLAVAGVLDRRMGGPGYSVFEPNDNYVRVYNPKPSLGPAEWRRMVYMTKVRMEHDPVFGKFDCPDAGQPAPQRPRSTTAIQALGLFNSRQTLDQAALLAARVQDEAGDDPAAQVERAFRLVFGRSPDEVELQRAVSLVETQGLRAVCRALLNANEFLFLP